MFTVWQREGKPGKGKENSMTDDAREGRVDTRDGIGLKEYTVTGEG